MAEPRRPAGEPLLREREQAEEYHYPPPREEPKTSSLAVASLATGIAAYFLVPIAGAIAAIITGFLAQDEIRASNGRLTGQAFATAGLVLGWVQIGIVLIFGILFAIFLAGVPGLQMSLPRSLFGG